jgi:hypothetical protein
MRRTSHIVFAVLSILTLSETPAPAFDYFEHRYLGNKAYLTAKEQILLPVEARDHLVCAERLLGIEVLPPGKGPVVVKDCPEKRGGREVPSNKEGRKVPSDVKDHSKSDLVDQIQTSFGDLSALAGDHAQGTSDLMKMIHQFSDHDSGEEDRFLATRRHWVQACRWYRVQVGIKSDRLSSLEQCFDQYPQESFEVLAQQYPGTTKGYEPSRIELAEFEKLSGYVGLANSNRAHFPKHSWAVYSRYHRLAMDCAKVYRGQSGFEKCQDRDGEERKSVAIVARALLYEGFAQHFLQDSFSSGHIGTNFGSCLWVFCSRNKRVVQHTHDQLNALGVEVKAHGIEPDKGAEERWTAYGDRHLFIPEAVFHRRRVESVAAESIAEVLRAMHIVDASTISCVDDIMRGCRETVPPCRWKRPGISERIVKRLIPNAKVILRVGRALALLTELYRTFLWRVGNFLLHGEYYVASSPI